jgi:DNA-binding protein HU-beta
MKKAMKAKAGKVMTKGALVKTLAEQHEMKTKACSGLLESLATLATTEVKKNGIFTIPGLCRIKTRVKPATKAGTRMMFGNEVKVKAQPARTVVKAYAAAALKKQV